MSALTAIVSILSAAAQLVPALSATAEAIGPAINNTAPISASDAATILSDIETAAVTVPALLPVVPLVQKALNGGEFNDTDLATLQTAASAIDAQVTAAAAAVEQPGS